MLFWLLIIRSVMWMLLQYLLASFIIIREVAKLPGQILQPLYFPDCPYILMIQINQSKFWVIERVIIKGVKRGRDMRFQCPWNRNYCDIFGMLPININEKTAVGPGEGIDLLSCSTKPQWLPLLFNYCFCYKVMTQLVMTSQFDHRFFVH